MIFSLATMAQNKSQLNNSLILKESPDGVYLMLSNKRISPAQPINGKVYGAVIYRSTGKDKFKEIGQVKPASTAIEFKAILGSNALNIIANIKKLKSEVAAWEYVQSHPNLEDYGTIALDLKLGVALGAYYFDKDAVNFKNTDITYQVRYKDKDGNLSDPVQGLIHVTGKSDLSAPISISKFESDSFVSVKWYLSVNYKDDAVFANVYKSIGNAEKYEFAGKIFANVNQPKADSIIYKWDENVKKGFQYKYFIQPTTIAFLPGANSDTVAVISANFSGLQQITNLKAVDTTQGIFLSWTELPNSAIYSGLVIERSNETVGPYVVIDTIPANAIKYLDTRIQANVSYYYRIHAVTIRDVVLPASDYTTAVHNLNNTPPESPKNLKLSKTTQGVMLKWNKNIEQDLAGYYVFRSSSEEEPELISLLIKDTTFVDTSKLYGRNTYYYEVKAMNVNNISGANSNKVSFLPENNEIPRTPNGLKGYANAQNITISWDDVALIDKFINGYNVYRKAGSFSFAKENNNKDDLQRNGFSKVNTTLLATPTFTEVVTPNVTYSYCVTSVDVFGYESYSTDVIILSSTADYIASPSNVTARKISKGIAVDWNRSLQNGIKQYVIYRRTAAEQNAQKIGIADAAKESFLDTSVKPGITYFYSVVIEGENAVSQKSLEAGVAY